MRRFGFDHLRLKPPEGTLDYSGVPLEVAPPPLPTSLVVASLSPEGCLDVSEFPDDEDGRAALVKLCRRRSREEEVAVVALRGQRLDIDRNDVLHVFIGREVIRDTAVT